jgi:hypothetical protein
MAYTAVAVVTTGFLAGVFSAIVLWQAAVWTSTNWDISVTIQRRAEPVPAAD